VERAEKDKAALEFPKSKGVNWDKRVSKWEVAFYIDRKKRRLGYYDDHVEAVAVYSNSQLANRQQTIDNIQ
jgi:hypothetical protein